MKKIKILFMICTIVIAVNSTPEYMDVITFTIDNYNGNGCVGEPGNGCREQMGDRFGKYAKKYTYDGDHRFKYKDEEVTEESLLPTNDERNVCDFVFYEGHGTFGALRIGCKEENPNHFIYVYVKNMDMGQEYIRWALFHSCHTLEYTEYRSDEFWDNWDGAFGGVKVVLGYKTGSGCVRYSHWPEEFWQNWVEKGYKLNMAFYHADRDNHGGGRYPALVTTQDYHHRESYQEADSDPGIKDAYLYEYKDLTKPLW